MYKSLIQKCRYERITLSQCLCFSNKTKHNVKEKRVHRDDNQLPLKIPLISLQKVGEEGQSHNTGLEIHISVEVMSDYHNTVSSKQYHIQSN